MFQTVPPHVKANQNSNTLHFWCPNNVAYSYIGNQRQYFLIPSSIRNSCMSKLTKRYSAIPTISITDVLPVTRLKPFFVASLTWRMSLVSTLVLLLILSSQYVSQTMSILDTVLAMASSDFPIPFREY